MAHSNLLQDINSNERRNKTGGGNGGKAKKGEDFRKLPPDLY